MHSWKAKGNANLLTKDMMAYGNTEDLLISFKFHKVHSLQTWFQFATRKHHCVLTNNRAPCFLYYVKKQSSTSLALDAFYSGPHHMAICMLPPWSLSSTLLQCQYYKICTQMFTECACQAVAYTKGLLQPHFKVDVRQCAPNGNDGFILQSKRMINIPPNYQWLNVLLCPLEASPWQNALMIIHLPKSKAGHRRSKGLFGIWF